MNHSYKYINNLPKSLLDDFVNGKVIPFIGAGFSKNADISKGVSIPDWNELGKAIASEIPDYEYENNPLDTLSYYETQFSRPKLIELLMSKLNVENVHPGDTYRAFCEVFSDIVCTTNFDFLLEDAYRDLHCPVSIIATEDRLPIATESEVKLIKLHGDFNHPDRMVITESDYDSFIENNPILATYISNLFITRTMLLVGYSLDDYDFRNLWRVINNRLGKMARPAYCILVGASSKQIARYQRRNIKVINLNGKISDYKDILKDFFIELKEYIFDKKAKLVRSTDEEVNEKILLPSDNNRLCFISCSMSRISRLKTILYPTLQEMGITPLSIDDMIMPEGKWMDVERMAIRKSNMVIVDISDYSPLLMYEFGIIQGEKKKNSFLVIAEKGSNIPIFFNMFNVLFYTFDVINGHNEINAFRKNLKKICSKTISNEEIQNKPFQEAQKLFEKNEFSVCIISACAELERLFFKENTGIITRELLLIKLKGKFNKLDIKKIEECFALRNKIIHNGYEANKEEAIEILKLVDKV